MGSEGDGVTPKHICMNRGPRIYDQNKKEEKEEEDELQKTFKKQEKRKKFVQTLRAHVKEAIIIMHIGL